MTRGRVLEMIGFAHAIDSSKLATVDCLGGSIIRTSLPLHLLLRSHALSLDSAMATCSNVCSSTRLLTRSIALAQATQPLKTWTLVR